MAPADNDAAGGLTSRLLGEGDSLRRQLGELRAQMQGLHERNEELAESNAQLTRQNDVLHADLDKARRENDELREESLTRQESIAALMIELKDETDKEIQSLKKEIEARNAEVATLTATLKKHKSSTKLPPKFGADGKKQSFAQNSSRRATSPRNSSGKVPTPTPRKSKKTDVKGSSSQTAFATLRVDEGSQSSAAAPSFVASESIAEDEDEHEPEEQP